VTLLFLVAIAFALLVAPTSALAITRATVLSRAQVWVSHPVPYSQAKYHDGYRTDCSGYVSACWATGNSWSTATFHAVTHPIKKTELKPGDAMLKKGYHIRLFHGWVDSSHTKYVAYEAGGVVAVSRVHSLATDLANGYVPTRYNYISDGPLPNNVLLNDSFDEWDNSWGREGDWPISWQVSGSDWETLVVHRTDVYHTPDSSLAILNSSKDPHDATTISQSAPVIPGATYCLSAWVKTDSDPAGVKLSVEYLDSVGGSIMQTSTTGDRWGIGPAAFGQMSAMTTAPANAASALVTVRVAGGTTAGQPGTSAIVDDISLARPQAAVRNNASASATRYGRTVTLSGSVTPTAAIGVATVVYVKRPGSKTWKRMTSAPVIASSTGAAWSAKYAFKRGMRKGVYRFMTVLPSRAGFMGATSRSVSVRLK
jgi:hypothetical protein